MSEANKPPAAKLATKDVMSFGPFRLDRVQRLSLEDDKPVHIGSRALDILALLLEGPGELATKNEIIARVWPGVFDVSPSRSIPKQLLSVLRMWLHR
jgi:DNA-binding winged helix-turn-helix (wHTH) protein